MTPEAKGYIDRIRESYLAGDDSAVASIMQELNEACNRDVTLLFEVYSVFPASMRRMLKELELNHTRKM